MPHTRYITNNNIDHFISLWEGANNEEERAVYHSLVVAEMDRFSEEQHRKEAVRRCLQTITDKIDFHGKLINEMRTNGHDTTQAEMRMSNLDHIHMTLKGLNHR